MNYLKRTVCHLPILALLAAVPIQSAFAASPPVTVQDASCTEFKGVKSVNADTATEIEFTNDSDSNRHISWLDYKGNPVEYKVLKPGESYVQPTYVTHPWLITDEAKTCVEIYAVQAGVKSYAIKTSDVKTTAVAASSTANNSSVSQIEFVGRIFDFSSEHPDFQKDKFGLVTGAVKNQLDADGLPVLVKDNVFPTHGTVSDFGHWYRDVPGVNQSKATKLILKRSEDGKFRAKNSGYFPIDGELLGDEAGKWKDHKGASRNFHFTTHLSGQFSYKEATDSFTFSGDDDLWVFFDGKLGIDLGGIHGEEAQTITGAKLQALGLNPGQEYKISIFHAERHTTRSNFNIETDFVIVPDEDYEIVGIPVAIGGETSDEDQTSYVGFKYLEKHFASLTGSKIDLAACGVKKGGYAGFGKREVPTNSHGDVHIFTPDGLTYDFQAGGEYTLVASSDQSVMVHSRQTIHDNDPTVSSNTGAAMQVGIDVVEFYSDKEGQRLYINGEILKKMPTKDFTLPGGGVIKLDGKGKSGPRFLVNWPANDFSVRVNLYSQFMNIGVQSNSDSRQYSGLLGNLDGNPQNDILPRNGGSLLCAPAKGEQLAIFGDSWKLSSRETLFRSELSAEFEALTVDLVTGVSISAETAIYTGLQENFGALGDLEELDIETIIITLKALYEFEEKTIRKTLAKIFKEERITTSEVTKISVKKITKVIKVREERYISSDITKVDLKIRAKAQQYCQVSGVTDQLALTNCILDVSRTGNKDYLHSAFGFNTYISELPPENRFSGSKVVNVLDPEPILDEKTVIEIAGPAPDPTTDFKIDIVPPGPKSQSNIKVELSSLQCSAETLPDAQALLEAEPQALAVAIYCAEHERGWSWGANYGLNREAAKQSASVVCAKRAENSVSDWGAITKTCDLFAIAERTIRFGDGISDDDGVRPVEPEEKPETPGTPVAACGKVEYEASSVAVSNLSVAVRQFSEDGLDVDLPNEGEFLFIRSADEQVVVHARRELWSADNSKSVLTAMHLKVGSDEVEIQAAPDFSILVNGKRSVLEEAGIITLSGGGSIISTGSSSMLITWPCTTFATEVSFWAGSHITIGFLPDPNMAYDGLVRFTERYLVTGNKSPFSKPVKPGMGCDCEGDEPPTPVQQTDKPKDPVVKKSPDACAGADDPFACENGG